MLIVLELVKISGMGYASVVCLVGKRSTFSKYTESAMMHRPWLGVGFAQPGRPSVSLSHQRVPTPLVEHPKNLFGSALGDSGLVNETI